MAPLAVKNSSSFSLSLLSLLLVIAVVVVDVVQQVDFEVKGTENLFCCLVYSLLVFDASPFVEG